MKKPACAPDLCEVHAKMAWVYSPICPGLPTYFKRIKAQAKKLMRSSHDG